LAACGKELVPRGFGPLALGEENHCAIVNGRFDTVEPIVRWAVVDRVLPYDSTRGPVEAFSLLGNADQALRLIAWSRGERRDTVHLVRNRHYRCSERRVVLDLPERLPDDIGDPSPTMSGRLVRANRLALAVGAEGALTADYSHETYIGVSVWCGDGCRDVPVPFSSLTVHTWTRVYPYPEDGKAVPPRQISPREQRTMDRLAEEEQALTEGRAVREGAGTRILRGRAESMERGIENGTRLPRR
jgi:hypothetical protein